MKFRQLPDTLVKHQLVFDVAEQVGYLCHILPFFHQRIGYQETFLGKPYDEMLFFERCVIFPTTDIAVRIVLQYFFARSRVLGERQFPNGYIEAFSYGGGPIGHDRFKSRPEGFTFRYIRIRNKT